MCSTVSTHDRLFVRHLHAGSHNGLESVKGSGSPDWVTLDSDSVTSNTLLTSFVPCAMRKRSQSPSDKSSGVVVGESGVEPITFSVFAFAFWRGPIIEDLGDPKPFLIQYPHGHGTRHSAQAQGGTGTDDRRTEFVREHRSSTDHSPVARPVHGAGLAHERMIREEGDWRGILV